MERIYPGISPNPDLIPGRRPFFDKWITEIHHIPVKLKDPTSAGDESLWRSRTLY